MYLTELYIGKL